MRKNRIIAIILALSAVLSFSISAFAETSKNVSLQVGDTYVFGSYEQDGNTSNGKEGIEWQVLASEKGKVLLLSKYALETSCFNTNNHQRKAWESSALREWLNSDFYSAAFSQAEKKMILLEIVPGDPGFACEAVNDTEDYVFLLGSQELSQYSETDKDILETEPTQYVVNVTKDGYETSWWLRSAGDMSNMECVSVSPVSGSYYIDEGGRLPTKELLVRPAIWVKVS